MRASRTPRIRPHLPRRRRVRDVLAVTGARQARLHVIDKANAHRDSLSKPLTMRRLQLAVCICRQNRLVDDAVLKRAGFNPGGHRTPHASAGVSTGRRAKVPR